MTSTNNRTINGYETIEGELVLSEITNQVLATDSDGLVYGINNYISNLTSDVQSQINTINTTLANKEDLLTAANKLDMAYVGSGNVSSDELDMNIGNTTFNIYNTFLSVTGSIDSLTQNKQNLLSSTNLLNASYIGTGIINNTVFNYLSGVTSDIQTQINSINLLMIINFVYFVLNCQYYQ